MGLCFTRKENKKVTLQTLRPLRATLWGPSAGAAEWQGSVVTALFVEVDLSFCGFFSFFLVIPPLKKEDDRGRQRLTPMAKELLSQNSRDRVWGLLLLLFFRGGGHPEC